MGARDRTPEGSVVVATSIALVVAFTVAAVAVPVADATHDEERTTDGFKAYTPGGEIPNPGDNMSVQLYMVPAFMEEEGPIPPDVEIKVDYQGYYTTTTSHCDTQDVYALGVDRGNDDPNTRTDDDLVQSLMENGESERGPADDPAQMTTNDEWDHRQFTWLELADEDDFPEAMYLHEDGEEDETILAVDECVEMPAEGWHRTFGMLNGTIEEFHGDREEVVIDGESHQEGDHFEIWESSLWYPVCECDESRHVAMELDPPPGEMTRGSEGGIIHPNGTIEAPYAEVNESGYLVYEDFAVPPEDVTADGIYFHDGFLELNGPIYYAAGHVEADGTIVTPGGDRIEPEGDDDRDRPTPTPTATPTETPTETPTDGDDGGDSGDGDGDGGETTTATPTETAPADEGDGDEGNGDEGDDGTTAGTDDDPQEQDPDAQQDGGMTPTPGEGPGFGSLAALAALLACVALMRRRG